MEIWRVVEQEEQRGGDGDSSRRDLAKIKSRPKHEARDFKIY